MLKLEILLKTLNKWSVKKALQKIRLAERMSHGENATLKEWKRERIGNEKNEKWKVCDMGIFSQ